MEAILPVLACVKKCSKRLEAEDYPTGSKALKVFKKLRGVLAGELFDMECKGPGTALIPFIGDLLRKIDELLDDPTLVWQMAFLALMDPSGEQSMCSAAMHTLQQMTCFTGHIVHGAHCNIQMFEVTDNHVCVSVFAVYDFEEVLSFFFRLERLEVFQQEHISYENMVENLTDELTALCKQYALETGWQIAQGHRPRAEAVRARKRTGKKTVLEELDSTDSEFEDEAGPSAAGGEGSGAGGLAGDMEGDRALATERVIEQHVREYMRERLQPGGRRIKDALAWWSTNHARWPMVAAVARHSLCVPAAAACSERGFSRTGHIVRARRSRLSDDRITELSHLSCNPAP